MRVRLVVSRMTCMHKPCKGRRLKLFPIAVLCFSYVSTIILSVSTLTSTAIFDSVRGRVGQIFCILSFVLPLSVAQSVLRSLWFLMPNGGLYYLKVIEFKMFNT